MEIFKSDSIPGRTVHLQGGSELLWFSGTDYLGMAHNEEFRKHLITGFSFLGNHYGGSRNNSLRINIFEETEDELADFVRAPAALTVSSGMWAGQLVLKEIEAIVKKSGSTTFHYHYAPGTHPAIRGNQYKSEKTTWNEWAYKTIETINRHNDSSAHIIVSDSIGSPWVEKFDFTLFDNLNHTNVWFVIDDSHGVGVIGKDGRGIYQELQKLAPYQVIVTASLNKGMGIPAGVLFAEPDVIGLLRVSPWFSAASPPLPASIYALNIFLKEKGYDDLYLRLMQNTVYLQDSIAECKYLTMVPGYPVMCTHVPQLFEYLLANGVLASKFPYPSAHDEPVTRIAISALHQKEDLDRMAEVCISFQNKLKS
jgi:8-amino-7-oxononanoate synthase